MGEPVPVGPARRRIVSAELMARRALEQAGEQGTENRRLRSWLDHALRCDTPMCRTCMAARAFLQESSDA